MPPQQIKLFILIAVTIIAAALFITPTTADTMFVGGKEYQLDPNVAAIYQYIGKDDPAFEWHELTNYTPVNNTQKGYMQYRLEFTSQQWLTEAEVNYSFWKHNLTIIVPYQVDFQGLAHIFITGCTVDSASCADAQVLSIDDIAVKSKVPIVSLTQIPNAALLFRDDPLQKMRTEDAAVAYTWAEYLVNQSRPDQILYFPMAKAAVMAAKVMHEWSKTPTGMNIVGEIDQFYYSGASKRGATTWFATAFFGEYMPERIIGAAPMVYDLLNITHSLPSMAQQLGGFTYEFTDYKDNGIIEMVNHPDTFGALAKHIDPLMPWYSNGLKNVHKLVASGAGDEFFLPLNSFYYDRTLPNKFHIMVPNARHSKITSHTYLQDSVAGHIRQLASKKSLPQWQQTMNYQNNTISVHLNTKPFKVSVWKNVTPPSEPTRMDFRLTKADIPGGCLPPAYVVEDGVCAVPATWAQTEIKNFKTTEKGYYYSYTPTPEEVPTDGKSFFGWYLMVEWNNDQEMGSQVYTSSMMYAPGEYPFPDCRPHCTSDLV